MKGENRPPCPKCNSNHIISHGPLWLCRTCGVSWSKVYRPPRTLPLDRPPCPRCKKIGFTSSRGLRWVCLNCKYGWEKECHPRDMDRYLDRPSCSRCGEKPVKGSTGRWKCRACGKTWNMETNFDLTKNFSLEVISG